MLFCTKNATTISLIKFIFIYFIHNCLINHTQLLHILSILVFRQNVTYMKKKQVLSSYKKFMQNKKQNKLVYLLSKLIVYYKQLKLCQYLKIYYFMYNNYIIYYNQRADLYAICIFILVHRIIIITISEHIICFMT